MPYKEQTQVIIKGYLEPHIITASIVNDNTFKICFGNFQWNQDWNYTKCCSWIDVIN